MDDRRPSEASPPEERAAHATVDAPPVEPDVQHVEISGKFIWQAIGAVLATLVLIWAVMQARGLVSMVAIAFFFSLALEPAVRFFVGRYGWRRGSATGVILAISALLVVFLVYLLIPAIAELAKVIGEKGAEWITNVSEWTADNLGFEVASLDSATDLAATTDQTLQDFATGAFGTAVDIATSGSV